MEQSWFDGSIMADAICAFTHLSSYFFSFWLEKLPIHQKKKKQVNIFGFDIKS